jgi:hypothetical protein
MDTTITWIDARHENPPDGQLVLAAVTGRYPADGEGVSSPDRDFWLVIATHFRALSPVEGTDLVVRDRYWDSDGVIRRPYGSAFAGPHEDEGIEEVTHWAAPPTLPGLDVAMVVGASVATAVAAAVR